MAVKIKDEIIVRSKSSGILYRFDAKTLIPKNPCKGYYAHGRCKHLKEVVEFAQSGDWIDVARIFPISTPVFRHKRVLDGMPGGRRDGQTMQVSRQRM